jgi:hypothetical protein
MALLCLVGSTIATASCEGAPPVHRAVPTNNAVPFSSISIVSDGIWEKLPPNSPNYFYERDKQLAGGSAHELNKTERQKSAGQYDCPWLFGVPAWCRKSVAFFRYHEPQKIAVDPKFDITIGNPGKTEIVVQSAGIEIAGAKAVSFPMDDWETHKGEVEGQYEIFMPRPPTTVRVGNALLDIEPLIDDGEREGDWTRDTIDSESIRALVQNDFEWPNLPIIVRVSSMEAVTLAPGASHRFNIVLKRWARMPNNVIVRFVVETDGVDSYSGYLYLLGS